MDTETPKASWRNRIVGSGTEDPSQLLANPKNWRIHPKQQQDALAGVLDEVGWVQQVLVNKRTGCVVDGHLRVSLALRRDEPEVPVLYVDLDEAEEALVLATLDPLSAMAGTDRKQLEALVDQVKTESESVQSLLRELCPPERMHEQLAELDITPELYERHDYLVVVFDNEFDWQVACERLNVREVKNIGAEEMTLDGPKTGLGRVVNGNVLLKAIGL